MNGEPTSASTALGRLASALFGLTILVFVVAPLAWLGVRAFAGSWTYPDLLPSHWSLRWWREVWNTTGLVSSIQQSLLITPIVTVLSMVVCLPAAFAIARYSFPGRQLVLLTIFATNAFPRFGLYITMASLFYSLNLMDQVGGVVIVQLIGTIVFMTWIPAAGFAAIPTSLEEAARDAGAGALRTFFTVTLPLAAPAIVVAVILSFLAAFDEAQGTFLVGSPDIVTMPVQMYTLIGNYPDQVAAVFSIILSVPSVLLLSLVRRRVLGGTVAQGFTLR